MTADGKLTQLFDVATADVPPHHLAPPLLAIRGRVRRRRRTLAVVTAAAVAAVAVGGFSVGQRLQAAPTPVPAPAGPGASTSPTPVAHPAQSWLSAMVARDDKTITVYAGPQRCQVLDEPRARVTEDTTRVTIEVTAKVVPAGDCTTSGMAVPISLTLDRPLDGRPVLDATGGLARPIYFERHLPDLDSDGHWSPVGSGSWSSDDPGWYESYNGPNGTVLTLDARPDGMRGDRVGTIDLGPHQGTITESGSGMWRVWWQASGATYSLRILPTEGASMTLPTFKRELSDLRWT